MKFKSNIKPLILLCSLICLICSILIIRGTFARYVTSLKTQSHVELASWLITINDQNVMENSDFVNKLSPIFNVDSEYIAENKIAPTSTGYVELKIDYSSVSVPFSYTITISQDDTTLLEDFRLKDYYKGATKYSYSGSDISLTYYVSPNQAERSDSFKFNFEWFDGSGEILNVIDDTKYSRDFENMKLNFNVSFTQTH